MDIVLAVLIVLLAIGLIVFVLFQTGGRSNKLSQSISGGSPENYTGKNKQRAKDKKYARVTTIIAILFSVLVIVFAVVINNKYKAAQNPAASTAAQTAAPSEDTNAADTEAGETETKASETPTEAATEAVTEAQTEMITGTATDVVLE